MNQLIWKSLEEGELSQLFTFPKELQSRTEQEVIGWIADYTRQYGQPPTVKRVKDAFPNFVAIESADPLGDVYDSTLRKKRNIFAREFLMGVQDKFKAGEDPLPYIQELQNTLVQGDSGITRYTTYDRSMYTRRETSHRYGINIIDKYTGGIGKGDLVYLIGRLGTGKTTVATRFVANWLQRELRLLMVSNENRASDIVSKVDAYIGGWNPVKRRTMDWNQDDMDRIATVDYLAKHMKGELFIPNRPVKSVEHLHGLLQTCKPDIVIVDGIYLINGMKGKSQWEMVTTVSRELKQMAEETGIPVLGMHQASREAVGKKIEVQHIAYADALAQDADMVLGINREETDKKSILVECIKNRWGAENWAFYLRLFFDTMTVKVVDATAAPVEV